MSTFTRPNNFLDYFGYVEYLGEPITTRLYFESSLLKSLYITVFKKFRTHAYIIEIMINRDFKIMQ